MLPSSKSPTSTLIPSLLALASALARFELLLVLSFSRLLLFVLLFSLTMIIVGSLVVLSALLSEFLFSFLSTSTFLTLGDAATDPTPAPITLRSMSAANVIEIVLFMDILDGTKVETKLKPGAAGARICISSVRVGVRVVVLEVVVVRVVVRVVNDNHGIVRRVISVIILIIVDLFVNVDFFDTRRYSRPSASPNHAQKHECGQRNMDDSFHCCNCVFV